MPLTEKTDYQAEEDTDKLQVSTDKVVDEVETSEDEDRWFDAKKFQDVEDDETAKDQTKVNTGEKGDAPPFLSMHGSLSGKENGQVQQNEKRGIRRTTTKKRLILNDIDSEIPLNESTTQAAQLNTVRDISFFNRDHRRRIFWTSEEEEMLKVGVEKFAAEAKKNMPWRKILAMGEKVFHETRTPANLKDKWRNMIGGRLGEKPN